MHLLFILLHLNQHITHHLNLSQAPTHSSPDTIHHISPDHLRFNLHISPRIGHFSLSPIRHTDFND